MVAQGREWGEGWREAAVTFKVQHGAGTVLYLDYINVNIPIRILH